MVFWSDRQVSLGYGSRNVLRDLHFSFSRGERWILMGANGCGKSTLLRSVLDPSLVQSGERTLTVPRSQIAFVPQAPQVSWNIPCTVREFLEASLGLTKSSWTSLSRDEISRVDHLISRVHLKASDNVVHLSGGQAQKLLLARALLLDAKILLLDEPFSAVDAVSRGELRELLQSCRAETLQILVLHDQVEADAMDGKILRLDEGRPDVDPRH